MSAVDCRRIDVRYVTKAPALIGSHTLCGSICIHDDDRTAGTITVHGDEVLTATDGRSQTSIELCSSSGTSDDVDVNVEPHELYGPFYGMQSSAAVLATGVPLGSWFPGERLVWSN